MDPQYAGLLKLAKDIGITRLADITGLDVAGVPVVQAIRPASWSNKVSQGKGATLFEATRSAVYESTETAFAEDLDRFRLTRATAKKLSVAAETFAAHATQVNWNESEIDWCASCDLLSGKEAQVPLSLVHTRYDYPASPQDLLFRSTTTGLAAGETLEHATLHGLLECIERDAMERAMRKHGFLHQARIDETSNISAAVKSLVDQIRTKGFLIAFWLAASPCCVPVVWCHVLEDRDTSEAILPFPGEGSAARFDVGEAMLAAAHEALQSRLTAIAASRDDFTRAQYSTRIDLENVRAHRRLMTDGPRPVDLRTTEPSLREDVPSLLMRLQEGGVSQVLRVDVDMRPFKGVSVTKVVVPGLLPSFGGT